MILKIPIYICLFGFGLAAFSQAAVPIKPQDDAQTIERINAYNKQQTETARTSFRNRILGTLDEVVQTSPKPTKAALRREQADTKLLEREKKEVSRAAAKDKRLVDRCEQTEAKINNRINRYEENIDKHASRLSAISEKLSGMTEVLRGKGCDVSQLTTLVASLDTKIAELSALYRTFISELQGTRSLVCGESNGEFVAMVKSSNSKLTEFRRQSHAMTEFVTDEVKPAFKAVAATCGAKEVEE